MTGVHLNNLYVVVGRGFTLNSAVEKDLFSRMVVLDQTNRMTLQEVLQHEALN
jgi:hypothetical protein